MFFQIALVIISLTTPEYLEKSFDIFIKTCVTQYRDDVDLQNLIDYTQLNFQCCGGVDGPNDWNENAYFKCDNKIIINGIQWSPVEECGVPFSCCLNATIDDNPNRQCGYGVRKSSSLAVTETFYQTGCTQKLQQFLTPGIDLQGITKWLIGLGALILLQMFPIAMANRQITIIKQMERRIERNEYRNEMIALVEEKRKRSKLERVVDPGGYFTLTRQR